MKSRKLQIKVPSKEKREKTENKHFSDKKEKKQYRKEFINATYSFFTQESANYNKVPRGFLLARGGLRRPFVRVSSSSSSSRTGRQGEGAEVRRAPEAFIHHSLLLYLLLLTFVHLSSFIPVFILSFDLYLFYLFFSIWHFFFHLFIYIYFFAYSYLS